MSICTTGGTLCRSDGRSSTPFCFLLCTLHSILTQTFSLRLVFELPPDTASLLPVASCVIVKTPADTDKPLLDAKGKPVIRLYTPISPSDQPGELAFLVKKYDQGKMSKHMHEMQPGDALSIKGPIPKFDFKSASHGVNSCSVLIRLQSTSLRRSG